MAEESGFKPRAVGTTQKLEGGTSTLLPYSPSSPTTRESGSALDSLAFGSASAAASPLDSLSFSGSPDSPLDSLGTASDGVMPIPEIVALPEFAGMIAAKRTYDRAVNDVSLGDPNIYLNSLDDYKQKVMEITGLSERDVNTLASQVMGFDLNLEQSDVVMRRMANVFNAAIALADPLIFAGDFNRTYAAVLADVQGERVAREQGLAGARDTGTPDPKTGLFAGSPAPDLATASQEMFEAFMRTMDVLGMDELPIVFDAVEGLQFNEDSGWFIYTPDIRWDRWEYGVSPYEANLAVTGAEFDNRFGISERLGIESEQGKEFVGFGVELMSDPYVWADFLQFAAKSARVAGRVTNNAALVTDSYRLEEVGRNVYESITPRGAIERGVGAARAPVDFLSGVTGTNLMAPIESGLNWVLNSVLDIPMPTGFLRESQRRAGRILTADSETIRPTLGDLLFSGGRPEVFPGQWRFLTGGDEEGLSLASQAMGMQQVVQGIALRGARNVSDALTEGLKTKRTFRFPWMRTVIPNAEAMAPEYEGYVRALGAAVSDFVDTNGVKVFTIPDEFQTRLESISELYDIPLDETIARFNNARRATQETMMQVGYEASGYRYYTEGLKVAAEQLGIPYSDFRRAMEWFYTTDAAGVPPRVDLQSLEATGFFPTVTTEAVKSSAPLTGASTQSALDLLLRLQNDPEMLKGWETAVSNALQSLGYNNLAQVKPQDYLAGIRDGYLRRMFVGVENPDEAIKAFQNYDLITVSSVNADDLADQFKSVFGDEVESAVRNFFVAFQPTTPRNIQPGKAGNRALTFNSEDLVYVLEEALNRDVSLDEVAQLIYGNNDNYRFLQETINLLEDYKQAAGGSALSGVPFGLNPAVMQARQVLNFEDIASRVIVRDPIAQLGASGIISGRGARSTEYLAGMYAGLRDNGFILPREEWPGATLRADARRTRTFTVDGNKWVAVPNDPGVWGPLANQAIPYDALRLATMSMSYGRTERHAFERWLTLWRRGLISPLSTALRNVMGNFALIQRATNGDLTEMILQLPRANRLRNEFVATGRLPEEFAGYEHFFSYINSSNKASLANPEIEEALQGIASGRISISSALDNIEQIVNYQTTTPALGGFLNLFTWGEELSRTTAFLSVYERLINSGMETAEAISRAAHFAANSAYNYGDTPLLPDLLRRTGASMFPQFQWFSIGRYPRTVLENPAPLVRAEHAREAANILAFGEYGEDEGERLTKFTESWLSASAPLAIPIPNGDGYLVFDLGPFYPELSNVGDLVTEVGAGGGLSPLQDVLMAWLSGSGRGFWGSQYGREVFNPASETGDQVTQTLLYLGRNYLFPTADRTFTNVRGAVSYNENPDAFDDFGFQQGQYFNNDWGQLVGQMLGFPSRRTEVTAGSISFNRAIGRINREYDTRIRRATQELAKYMSEAYYDPEIAEQWQERIQQLALEKAEALSRLVTLAR